MCVWFIDFFLSRASISCDWISGCTIPCWFVYQCESSMGKRTAQHIDDSTEFHRFFSPIFFFIASHRIASISLFNFMVRWICEFLAAKFRPKDTQSTGKTWKIHEKYMKNTQLMLICYIVYWCKTRKKNKNTKNKRLIMQTVNGAVDTMEIFYWIMKNCIYKLIIWWWFGERRSFLAW